MRRPDTFELTQGATPLTYDSNIDSRLDRAQAQWKNVFSRQTSADVPGIRDQRESQPCILMMRNQRENRPWGDIL